MFHVPPQCRHLPPAVLNNEADAKSMKQYLLPQEHIRSKSTLVFPLPSDTAQLSDACFVRSLIIRDLLRLSYSVFFVDLVEYVLGGHDLLQFSR